VKELAAYLQGKRLLLLVDNFEHLLPAAPDMAHLLEACPLLTVLVTSRAQLRLRGEREMPVEPLAVPDPLLVHTPDAVAQYPAVALYIERVQDHHPAFILTTSNAGTVAEICCRLDGLPLALELAAAQSRLFSPRALLVRLERRLDVLTGGPADLPARQQTMSATLASSYDLLPPGEQTLFRRLAVFVGGCTLAAIEDLCLATGGLDGDVLDRLRSLAEKSLLRRTGDAGAEMRFGMLETIREYGLERLMLSGELAILRRAHAQYFLSLVEQAEPQLKGPQQAVCVAQLE
jgi:predicted ATPase